jgi:hypothetical protein
LPSDHGGSHLGVIAESVPKRTLSSIEERGAGISQRRLIAERTRDGMNAARAKGSRPGRPPLNPEKLEAALLLVEGGMSPTKAARRTALGRSTLYREIQARDHA